MIIIIEFHHILDDAIFIIYINSAGNIIVHIAGVAHYYRTNAQKMHETKPHTDFEILNSTKPHTHFRYILDTYMYLYLNYSFYCTISLIFNNFLYFNLY